MELVQQDCRDSLTKLATCKIVLAISPAPVLTSRPQNDTKFLQALAQLHQEFQISKKPSTQKLLEQIEQQRKMFDIEINQQRHELRENYKQLPEKRIRLKDILTQLTEEYACIKNKNKKMLAQINLQDFMPRITKKISNNDYLLCNETDSLQNFNTFYNDYNISSKQENELKNKLRQDCLKALMKLQITVMDNGSVVYYDVLANTIQMILVDLSDPKIKSKIEKQKKELLNQEMRETFLAILDIEKNIALIQLQVEARDKKITRLMLKQQELLNPTNIQAIQNRVEEKFDKEMYQKIDQDLEKYISNISITSN